MMKTNFNFNVYRYFRSHIIVVCDWKYRYAIRLLHQWGWSI